MCLDGGSIPDDPTFRNLLNQVCVYCDERQPVDWAVVGVLADRATELGLVEWEALLRLLIVCKSWPMKLHDAPEVFLSSVSAMPHGLRIELEKIDDTHRSGLAWFLDSVQRLTIIRIFIKLLSQ